MRIERVLKEESATPSGEVRINEREEVVWVGESSARLDARSASTIVRLADGVFVHLDHSAKAYVEVALPMKLEDFFSPQEKECLRQSPQALANTPATVKLTGEERLVEGRRARKLRTEWEHFMGLRFEQDKWLSDDLPIDVGPYLQLIRHRAALSSVTRGWIDQVVGAGGFPIESTTKLHSDRGTRTVRRRLASVTVVDADPSRYLPPPGYSPTLERPPLDLACVGTPRQ
ncbi:MAG: hypothetical protein AAF657_33490 [Acidobacteriota bacterium]